MESLEPLPAQPQRTIADLIDTYVTEYLPSKADTTRIMQGNLLKWLKKEWGAVPLDKLTPAMLREWRQKLEKRYKPGTVRRYLDSLSGPLTVAVRDLEWLKENPMRKVRKPALDMGRARFLTEEELSALLYSCQISRNPHLYTIVLVALNTGARKMEIITLRWQDVDLVNGMIRLMRTKNKQRRAVPLVGKGLEALRELSVSARYRPDAYCFPRTDGKPVDIDIAFRWAVKRAKITDFHFHDLRHTAASYLAMSGASIREIAEVLGHKNITITHRYSHLTEAHTMGVMQRMARQFLGAGEGQ